jgi:hypothetical protein
MMRQDKSKWQLQHRMPPQAGFVGQPAQPLLEACSLTPRTTHPHQDPRMQATPWQAQQLTLVLGDPAPGTSETQEVTGVL